ncbi:DMT family transporter [Marinoscillum furvescens]|uniref:EamA domain-containing membrane protein RarD n=1 Tax=Marinoscillum furvescens DSM 4134 TaxID=1122208 RepID=A0A3D9L868_MARFU|nr:DMT family transporter [Marinoscillum furvescens]REE01067.1 EamA domain-containing membrane protein RarD [Marinoscillum furvescens DSM 4134]
MSKGVRYMLVATFMFTLMKVCVKLVPHIPAIEVILFRSLISLVISVYYLRKQRVSVWGNNKPILVLRGATGAVALITYFSLIQQIPLATMSTLQYLAPIFTAILGIFLVKEKVRPWQWVFFAVSFAGVLVVRGFDDRISLLHLGMGIGASLFMGLAYNFIRMLKTSEHPLVIIFYFPLVLLPIAGVWSAMVWVQPQGWDWLVLLAVGLCTQIAQFFMTKSYQSEELSKVSILNYIGLIYALLFGWVLFDETFNLMTYLGMALVIAGVALNVVLKKKA